MTLIGLVILSGFSCRRRLHSVAMPYKLGRKEGVGSFPEVQLKPSVLLKTLDLHLVAEQESCHLLDHVCLGRGGSLPSRLMVVSWCLPGGPVFATDFAFALPFPLSGRAGQGRAGQGRAGQRRAGQGRAGQGRQGRAGQGRAGQGRAGQGRAGQGRAGQGRAGRAGQGRAGQGRAGQGRAGQGRAGQGRAGQGRAGQGRAGQGRAGQGRAGQGRAGQGRAGQGRAGQGRAGHRAGHRAGRAGQGRTGQSRAGQAGQGTEDSVLAKNAPCELRGTDAINSLNIDFSMSLVH